MEFRVGNFGFQIPPHSGLRHLNTAIEWAYNLQHKVPNSQGLELQIAACELSFPTTLISSTGHTVSREIPEPTYRSPSFRPLPAWTGDIPSQFNRAHARSSQVTSHTIELRLAQVDDGDDFNRTPPPHDYINQQPPPPAPDDHINQPPSLPPPSHDINQPEPHDHINQQPSQPPPPLTPHDDMNQPQSLPPPTHDGHINQTGTGRPL